LHTARKQLALLYKTKRNWSDANLRKSRRVGEAEWPATWSYPDSSEQVAKSL